MFYIGRCLEKITKIAETSFKYLNFSIKNYIIMKNKKTETKGDLFMYQIKNKVSIGILCAIFALIMPLIAVFSLAPNTSAAHAETEYTVVWDLNVIKTLPEYEENKELASITDAASSRTITMKSVNGYIYHSYNYDYEDPVYEYSELHNSSVEKGFTFSISNPSETSVTYFTKIEIKGSGANISETPTDSGWTQNDYSINWNGSALTVDFNVDGYVGELSEIKYTFKIVDGFVTTLNTNGGTINSGNVTFYEIGVGATLPTDVTKKGYGFKGWYDNAAFDGDPVTSIEASETGAKEFWAKWIPTVTLNTNDGTVNSGDVSEYIEGVGATLPTDVTKENCTFGGWYDNATFDGDPVTAIGTDATGGKTYWAKWICSVTFNTNGGTINSGNVTEYAEGVGATLPTDVTKEDVFFAGWYDNASFEGDPVTTIGTNDRGPKEYWAKWLDHIHEYSSAWSYNDSKHWHACTSTKGECDAPIIDEEEHSFDESVDTTAYYKCKCDYEDAERKNTFYNDVTTVEIDTNKGQSVYTKRNVTITVTSKGDNDGAGINDTNTMVIEITGNIAIKSIRFVSGVGSWYTNYRAGFTVKRGYTSTTCTVTFNDNSQEIVCNNLDSKRAVVNNTKGWMAIKKVIIESTIAASPVVYNLDGGEFDDNYQDYYVHGQWFTLPTNVVKSGYVFRGWYNNEELTGNAVTSISSGTTGEQQVWAKYDATITYNQNGGTFDGTYPTTYALGVGASLPTNISKNGYAFGGWWDNADFEGAPIATIGTDATEPYILWAKWYPIGYHLIGTMTDWKVDETCLLTKNTAVTDIDEYYIELPIAAGSEFKVVHGNAVYGETGVTNTWYPDGMDNNYIVSESGFYRVFFRPDGNGNSDWHEKMLWAKRLFAQVNGINYYTIEDAYAVVAAGGTVKLVDDLDLSGATDRLDVTKNVTVDLNGHILNITTSGEPKIVAKGGAVITLDDLSDVVGGVKGVCGVDTDKGSYIVLKNCRLSLEAADVRFGWRINRAAEGYVVRAIEGAPDADGFVTLVRLGTDQEIADDVVELIDAIGTVEATLVSKQKINDARERYDALTTEQKELVAEAKLTTLENAETQYIQFVVDAINALPAVGVIVCEDKPNVQNARELYDALTDTEKDAFSAEVLATLQAAEVDIADCEKARAVENRIEALPSTILFEHTDDVARARVAYDALTDYQKGKVPTATYDKLPAAETVIAEWIAAMMVIAQIEALPSPEKITIDNKTRIEAARAKYDALTDAEKAKVEQATVDILEAAENAWATMKAQSDIADVVEEAISAIGKLERTEACQQKIANAREQYNNLTDLQKSLVDNYYTLVSAETNYAAYVTAADEVIGKINAIGTVENTEASKQKIDEARAAFNALLTEIKEFVTNYDSLASAESIYDAFTPSENVAEIGETKYTTVLEAFTTAKKGETVKLLTDIDLSDKGAAYITIRRDITIDLNGHDFNVTSASLTYIVWASDGAIVTIDNSVPGKGGIKGLFGADYLSGADIVLRNCRLTISMVEFSEYDAFLSIGEDCLLKDLNNGKTSVVGYASIVRPIGDQDKADEVDALIKAIGEIAFTDECNSLIIAAREGYDALTDEQKALVENISALLSAESTYAALATAKIENLVDDEITIADKPNVEKARAIYDALTDAEKEYVPDGTVTKLTDAEAALAVILKDYILAGDDCIHRSVQITDVYVSTSALTQSSYSDPNIQNGYEGIKIRFKKSNVSRTTEGTARVTVKIALAEAHEVEIWWKFDFEAIKHTCSLKYTHDSVNWVSAPTNAEWKVDRVYLEAGTYTFQYECNIGRRNPLSSEYKDRYFYVMPMLLPSFDDNCICTLCGTECLHETVSVAYDAEQNDYHFVCNDGCLKTIDLKAISFDQETSFETARAAYDALTDEQKAMFRPSDLFKLEAHESIKTVLDDEQTDNMNVKAAFKVTDLINGLPEASAVTLKDTIAVQAARAAYEALTDDQKAYVTTATLARLTDVEKVFDPLKQAADEKETQDVIALIDALPDEDAITFENRSLIEQARVGYEMLTSAQKAQVTTATRNVLSAAELKGVLVSWEDVFPENGTYILVSATDESKALVRIDSKNIKIATYDLDNMDVNDPDVATANNRDFKWKIERQGSNVFYTLINIFYTGERERLLDVAAWDNQLSDGSSISFVGIDAGKSENETNVFRFSKRIGVDMEDDEYYIRVVSTRYNKYNFAITLRSNDSINVGTYRAKNAGQVWKLVRVKGDEDFAQEVMDQIATLPTYDDVVLDDENDIKAVRTAYETALTDYQKTLVKNLAYLVSAEQKIVDIKVAKSIDEKISAIGTVEDTTDSKAKVDEVREAYNAITDAQKLLVTVLDTLVAAETKIADFLTADVNAIPSSADIAISDKTAITKARTKFEALTPEEKTHVTQATVDKLSAAEVTITVISLPEVGVLTLENKDAVVAARTEYTALSDGAKDVFGVLDTLVAAETEIADIEAAKAVTDAIIALPEIENIAVDNKNAVSEVMTAYKALSTYQKGKVPADSVNKLFAEETSIMVIALPAYDDVTLENETVVNEAYASYSALTEDQKQTMLADVSAKITSEKKKIDDMNAAKAVTSLINEIGDVEYTDESKEKIDTARIQYNKLTDEQKAFVTSETVAILTDAEEEYAAAANVAIYEKVSKNIDELTDEDKEYIAEAKATYDELTDEEKDLIPQDTKDKLFASVTTIEILNIPEAGEIDENITDEDANAIKAAKESYDNLTPEQQALIPNDAVNKVLASATTLEIVELPDVEDVTVDDKADVLAAKEAFDDLTTEQKDLIPQTTKDKLFAITTTVAIVEIPVSTEIDEDITDEDANAIKAAKSSYDELTDDQKKLVPEEITNKVFASDSTLSIVELTDTDEITVSDKDAIQAARAKYDALTPDQKDLIPKDAVDTLIASEAVLDIVELPVGTDITADDEDSIKAARNAYNDLTPEQKEKVPQDTVNTLVAAEAILDIVELPVGTDISTDDEDSIQAARKAYNDLTTEQKEKVPQATVDTLVAAEMALTIVKLPAIDDITVEAKNDVVAVKEAYDALSDEQKAKVAQNVKDKLLVSVATIEGLEILDATAIDKEITDENANAIKSAKETYDALNEEQKAMMPDEIETKVLVSATTLAIVKLPDVDDITADDAEAVVKARELYNSLSDEQKALISKENEDKLLAATTMIASISVPDVANVNEDITEEDANAIKAAKAAYDSLTDEQKDQVPEDNRNKLLAASAALDIIELTETDEITVDDKEAIEKARKAYNELDDTQKGLIPKDVVDTLIASEAVLDIVELPVGTDISTDDEDSIQAARNAYNDLTPEQKEKVPQDTVNTLVAAEAILDIVELPVGTDISTDDEDSIQAARKAYNDLTTEQKEKVPQATVDTLVAAETVLTIVKLPDTDEITTENDTVIKEAKAAYENLTEDQKKKVPQDTVNKLYASVTTVTIVAIPVAEEIDENITDEDAKAIKAAKESYDNLTPEQQALIPNDAVNKVLASATTLEIVELPDIEDVTVSDKADVLAAKDAFDDLTPEQKDLIPQTTKDKLFAITTTVAIVEIPVSTEIDEDITDENANAIKAAKAAYDELTDDQKKLVPEEITNKVFASDATLSIVELTDTDEITVSDKDAIQAARAKYDALTPDQKDLIPKDAVDTLISSEAVLSIVELPVGADITADDEDAIKAARAKYDDLTPEQKGKVTQDTVNTLYAAESVLAIVELPVGMDITTEAKTDVLAARASYDALTDEQKAKVPQDTVDTLYAAESVLAIFELPTETLIEAEDEDAIKAARAKYDNLTEAQKKKVPQAQVDKLAASEGTLAIVKLPDEEEIVAEDKAEILSARAAYEKLTDEQKDIVPNASKDKLIASEVVLEIIELTDTDEITPDDEETIVAARKAFEALSEKQKYRVPKDIVDTLCASESTLSIVKLPVVGELTFEDKSDVLAAKAQYDALSEEGKEKVSEETLAKLLAAETEIADIEAAKETTEAIDALPTAAETTREDREAVFAAKKAYDNLTTYQQSKVSEETVAKLVAAVEIFVAIDKIDAIGEVAYTPETKALIDDAKESYDDLSDSQKEAIDNADKLQKADTDYNAVDEVVTKIEAISDIRYDERSGNAIDDAREEYTSLTADQQALLSANTYQKLVDAETVYVTLGKINAIGSVEYSEESKNLIDEARNNYDALSDEQKALINVQDLGTLTASEDTYTEKDNSAKATYTSLLAVVSVLLVAGLFVLAGMIYLQVKGKKKKGTKTFSAILPLFLLGATHYVDSPFIALYVLAGIMLVVFAVIIVMAIKNPKLIKGLKTIFKKENKEEDDSEQEEKKVETVAPIVVKEEPKRQTIAVVEKPVAVETPVQEVSLEQDEAEEDGGVVVDAKGNYFNIRYNKSFTAKLIQSSDETKKYYGELKNEVLSYAKAKSRVSWAYDSVNAGRVAVAKFGVRGKTLCLYLPLKAEELDEKYKVETIESTKYSAVPCMYRIKNDRRLRYAKELIAMVYTNLGLEKGETKAENYYLPYETTEALIGKELIKELTLAATATQIEKAKTEGTIRIVESVSATEVNSLISTEIATAAITESDTHATGKKGIVNVDTLSMNYNAGDTVTVKSLQEKKLIAPGVKQVKLLARGKLNKALHVELQDYSIEAVKMILATGGTVKRC